MINIISNNMTNMTNIKNNVMLILILNIIKINSIINRIFNRFINSIINNIFNDHIRHNSTTNNIFILRNNRMSLNRNHSPTAPP